MLQSCFYLGKLMSGAFKLNLSGKQPKIFVTCFQAQLSLCQTSQNLTTRFLNSYSMVRKRQ